VDCLGVRTKLIIGRYIAGPLLSVLFALMLVTFLKNILIQGEQWVWIGADITDPHKKNLMSLIDMLKTLL
jgi:hypothetical protein